MERVSLAIEGMSCGDCVRAVATALESLDGVRVERVDIGAAWVAYDPARTDRERLHRAVEEAGFRIARLTEVR